MAKSRQRAPSSDGTLGNIKKSRKQIRSGIAVKFAVPISIVIIAMMAILGLSIRSSTEEALERSIQQQGIFAATAAAAPDWHHEDNLKRLATMLTESVEDVVIWEPREAGKPLALVRTASARAELAMNRGKSDYAAGTNVKVERGRMTSREGSTIPYRSFTSTIKSPGDDQKMIGAVEVILSEKEIESRLSSITSSIIILTIVGIIIGVGVSILMAKLITRPLHELIQDVEIVAGGNLQHRTPVRSGDEVGLLAMTFDEMTRELAEKLQLEADLSSKQHEEQITQQIQERLFPSTMPDIGSTTVEAVMEPAEGISSDMFDFLDVGGGKTGFLVMSASGRGVPAAVVLAMARSTFRAAAAGVASPAEALRRINALFSPDLRRGMYVTAMYVIYDPATSKAWVASAGHKMPALFWSAAKKAVGKIHPPGIAMGLDKGPVFDRSMSEAEVVLEAADALILASVGITELVLESGDPVGEARFFKTLQTTFEAGGEKPIEKLVKKIDANLGKDPGAHDILLVGLRRT